MTVRPSSSEGLITRLDGWLATNKPEYYERLRPAATEAQWSSLDPRVPATLRAMYRWRNGDDSTHSLFHSSFILDLDEAANRREDMGEIRDENDYGPEYWSDDYLPVFDCGDGNLVCIALDSGAMMHFVLDDDACQVAASCESYLRALVDSLEAGLWTSGRHTQPLDWDALTAFCKERDVLL